MGYRYINTDDAHLHTYGGKPLYGTSTISKLATFIPPYFFAGKTLEPLGWTPTKTRKSERVDKAGNSLGEIKNLGVNEYLELLDKCYHNHKTTLDKSAVKGTDLHAELERYVNVEMKYGTIILETFDIKIHPFIEWSKKNVKKWLWSEANCYSKDLWCGGIIDAGCQLNDDTMALIDFKSSPVPRFSHWIQCAGYTLLLEENGICDENGNNIPIPRVAKNVKFIDKIIIFPFGAKTLEPCYNTIPIEDLKKGFINCLELYKLMNREAK